MSESDQIARANELHRSGRMEEALAAYEEAITASARNARHSENVVAKIGRAEVLRHMNRPEEALAIYEEAIAENPKDVIAKIGRARSLRQIGDLVQSEIAFRQIIADHPQHFDAKLAYAETLSAANRHEEAESVLRDLIASHPENSERLELTLREMRRRLEAEPTPKESVADLDVEDAQERLSQNTDPLESEFRFSKNAKQVLVRARSLADETQRAGVTSSCLLFGFSELASEQIDTTRFVRDALDRSGRYEDALAKFRRNYGKAAWATDSGSGALLGKVSKNVRAIFEHAANIALRASAQPREIHTRHLFAALIVAPDRGDRPVAVRRLDDLGIELSTLRQEFREFIRTHVGFDNSNAWDAILTPGEPHAEQANKKPSASDGITYQPTYSAFIPDRAIYGSRSPDESLADELKAGVHAGHLAQLIAAKETSMPLSIGLFGPWGSGKSYFIDLLDEKLRALRKTPGKVFHQQIVQIRFNAWHYLDTNLWANLVCEIFDQLFAALDERKDATAEQVKKLKSELTRQSALAAEAKEALKKAGAVRIEAEKKLHCAMLARAKEERKVGEILDDLKSLLKSDPRVRDQLQEVAASLGLPKLETSFAELETQVMEMRSLAGRAQALALAVLTGPGWQKRMVLLAAAVAVPIGVAALAAYGPQVIQDLLEGAVKIIAQIGAAIAAFSAWLSQQAKTGNSIVQGAEAAYDKVKTIRDAKEKEDKTVQAQRALAARRQEEEQARHTLHEAEEKMKTIQAELAELAPGRQLIRFLKERASAEDYKRHLGLVSLVRRDFAQLSQLFTKAEGQKDPSLPQIDRIVLYIDDLDRCRADRVIEVLEAVHLLLAFPLFAVVVAVDPRWLRQSLLDHYPRLLGGAEDTQAKLRVRTLGRPATPQDYLEKIFQVPFNIQTMEDTGFKALVADLFSVKKIEPKTDAQSPGKVPPPAKLPPTSAAPTAGAELKKGATASDGPGPSPSSDPAPPTKPPDPQRLALTPKEIADVQRFQPLFQTPRAVKRLANTYCLIRVGVEEKNWAGYLGPGETPGTYRVAMLLLAVTSSFPALARPWLLWLLEAAPTQWQLSEDQIASLADKNADTTDRADWERLAGCLKQVSLEKWPAPVRDQLKTWVPRVARYSF